MNSLLLNVISLAKQAGELVLSIYHNDFPIEYKPDNSPVTIADRMAHEFICQGLNGLLADTPILSEEFDQIGYSERQTWRRYWLIDPLDGTREFLDKNGEFTINIALIEEHVPILGVIYAPLFDFCYFAENTRGAYKQIAQRKPQALHTCSWEKTSPIMVTSSRHHGKIPWKDFLLHFPALNLIRCGSALKFCWIAEGFVDIYPRFSPTCEWDTAAGQCILQEAGGKVIDQQGQILRYNTKSSLHNNSFLAVGDQTHLWLSYFNNHF
jgi:3'(2'), 5'-bisphosphate nucleotidase